MQGRRNCRGLRDSRDVWLAVTYARGELCLMECTVDTDCLIGDCVARARAIKRRSDQIANDEFPTEEPQSLARALGDLAELTARHVVNFRYDPGYQAEKGADHVRNVSEVLNLYCVPLAYIEGAATRRVPWSIVPSLQLFAQRLLPDVTLMFCRSWQYNYYIIPADLRECLRDMIKNKIPDPEGELTKSLKSVPPNFYVVMFPYIERRSVLLHATLAHEIGHLVINKYILDDRSVMPEDLVAEIKEFASGHVGSQRLPPLAERLETVKRVEQCSEYRRRAIAEIGADLVGIRMLGPAALFAYESLSAQQAPDTPPRDNQMYPPWRLRLRCCLDELGKMGLTKWEALKGETGEKFGDILDAYQRRIEEISSFVQVKSDQRAIEQDPLVNIAYKWFFETLPKLQDFVRGKCKGKTDLDDVKGSWREMLFLAYKRLEQNLPPNIIDDTEDPPNPSSLELILNAAWLHRIARVKVCPSGPHDIEVFIERRDRLDRLALRGIELAELQRTYEAVKTGRTMRHG